MGNLEVICCLLYHTISEDRTLELVILATELSVFHVIKVTFFNQ